MPRLIQSFRASRHGLLLLLLLVHLALATASRAVIFVAAWGQMESPLRALAAFPAGLAYDLAAGLYLLAPLALWLTLVPERLWHTRASRGLLRLGTAASVFGLLYLVPVEYFYFEEFSARFHFAAVDYLIYPHEVMVNLWESYPVALVLAVAAGLTLLILRAARRHLALSLAARDPAPRRWAAFGAFAAVLVALHLGLDSDTLRRFDGRMANEVAANGVYAFGHAALTNELVYSENYPTLPRAEARERLRRLVGRADAPFLGSAPNALARRVNATATPRPLNVVVIVEESFGSEFVGALGDGRGLTPEFDRLAADGLLFTHAYASGTRTVRGLEAISASFPPIPGEAILRRPGSEGMYTWGDVMRGEGYEPVFLYGGYGSFDNMNHYFGSNGYRVVDRTDIPKPRFANIWGVSDEDLFEHSLGEFDRMAADGKRIFGLIMTTSNHKPYTFPAGVPGVPESGGGRDAGVRYADHALGRFFDAARGHPWFKDTLFVVVADHGARVYGRAVIPVRSYEIPLLVYAPGRVSAGRDERLVGQIDIAPTVLGLLGISYDSLFFGRDALAADERPRWALLSHNHDVALFSGERLHVLSPRGPGASYAYDRASDRQTPLPRDAEALADAASIFQEGYRYFAERLVTSAGLPPAHTAGRAAPAGGHPGRS